MEKDCQVVGFRIGNETYGVRIASVREIVRVPEITTVPNAPDLIEGVINLRGKIIPVMDLRKRRREEFKERFGVDLGFMPFFVKAFALVPPKRRRHRPRHRRHQHQERRRSARPGERSGRFSTAQGSDT